MSLDNKPVYSGGCQCGAVRFRVEGALGEPSICHCRMCQKAFGSFYAPLVSARKARLTWTRGERKRFHSSNHVYRGFCGECGTPLTYETPTGVSLAVGAFDDPSEIVPKVQDGIEAKIPYVDTLHGLPGLRTDEYNTPFLKDLVSYQHPDHDTEKWPPAGRE